jgi:hypothetical protein
MIKDSYASIIYVLREEGIYQYEPVNHSLVFYKTGDYRYIGQYNAPIQLGICWDTTKENDENISGTELGEIGQNIYLSCIAMDLGTVATAEIPSPLSTIGLPEEHVGRIVMPIGHPTQETKYLHLPMWISFLPQVTDAGISLSEVLETWNQDGLFAHESIPKNILSQFIWACYGYSYYLDHSGFETHPIERHRTVPSAHGYYPLEVFAATKDGIYRYIPGLRNNDPIGLPLVTFLWNVNSGNHLSELADVTDQAVAEAPLSLIIVLNIPDTVKFDDLSDPMLRWIWTYEAGSCAQNVLLDSTAWDYSSMVIPINQKEAVNSLLGLDENFDPFYILPIG